MSHPGDLPFSAPAARNADPILEILKTILLPGYRVLEIASGTGQHVAHFAESLPEVHWQPTECNETLCARTAQRLSAAALPNIEAPIPLDVLNVWPTLEVDAVIVANMLHISPIDTLANLCAGAREVCRDAGWLHIYGPFKQGGEHTSEGNLQFDASLRQRNPLWGIRDVELVIECAEQNNWQLRHRTDMPANNFSLLFQLANSASS